MTKSKSGSMQKTETNNSAVCKFVDVVEAKSGKTATVLIENPIDEAIVKNADDASAILRALFGVGGSNRLQLYFEENSKRQKVDDLQRFVGKTLHL